VEQAPVMHISIFRNYRKIVVGGKCPDLVVVSCRKTNIANMIRVGKYLDQNFDKFWRKVFVE